MENEKDGYVGEFNGNSKMRKDANWFKSTHFKFGGDGSNRYAISQIISFFGVLYHIMVIFEID